MIARMLMIFAAAALVSGCSTVRNPPRLVENTQPADTSPAARMAQALAAAHRADAERDSEAMGEALTVLDSLGAQPLDEGARLARARWEELRPAGLPPMRGRTLGPGFKSGTIRAGGKAVIEQTFLAGKKASIALSAPSGAPLELGVRDPEPRLLCEKRGVEANCSWIPVFTGRYRIELANPGRRSADYYLVIN